MTPGYELDHEVGLSYCGENEELYEEVLQDYAEENCYDRLAESYAAANWKDFCIYAHGVKSASLTIGATRLSEEAKAMEFAVKEDRLDYIPANYEAFMAHYRELIDYIRAL